MSWSIGLHLGEHFADLIALNKELYKRRFSNPQSNVESALQQMLQELDVSQVTKVCLYTDWPSRLAVTSHGSETAVLITSGFENWLEMTTPLRTQYFTSEPSRPEMPIDRELFLGVSERTNARGQVEKPLDLNDLEFIASKLQLHEIKDVAVCFLHSTRNDENEVKVKEFLEPKGFRVHISSSYSGVLDEKARFWSTILNAYVVEAFIARLKKLKSVFEPLMQDDPQSIFVGPHSLQDILDGRVSPLKAAISYYNQLDSLTANNGPMLYAGFENFVLFAGNGTRQDFCTTRFGPLALSCPSMYLPRIQPLTLLTKGFISPIGFSSDLISHERGPMVLGRGLVPTFFDLISTQTVTADNNGLTALTDPRNERGRHHFMEQLSAYARNFHGREHLTGEALANRLFALGCEILSDEISSQCAGKDIKICGPFASAIAERLGATRILDDFVVLQNSLQNSNGKKAQL